jgi:hypothetical protein
LPRGSTRWLSLAALALLLALSPSAQARAVRVFAVQPKLDLGWMQSRQTYHDARVTTSFIAAPGGRNRQVDPYGGRQLSTFAPSLCDGGGGHAIVAFQDSSARTSAVRTAAIPARRTHVLSGAPGDAWRPRIACANGRGVVVWEDERDGPPRLYYAVRSARSLW